MKTEWFLYIIRTEKGSLYTGITTDIERRFNEHQSNDKKSAKYMRGKGTLELVFQHKVENRSIASKLELKVKKLSRLKKEDLISGQIEISVLLNSLN